jgi:ferredoxin-NADP reductase
VGTTPVRALLEEIDAPPGAVTLVERSRSVEEVLFGGELESLARRRGARVEHLIGPRARDGSWLPRNCGHLGEAEALQLLVPRIAEAEVYVCGPPAWAQAAVQAARSAGVPRSRIHEEKFAW